MWWLRESKDHDGLDDDLDEDDLKDPRREEASRRQFCAALRDRVNSGP